MIIKICESSEAIAEYGLPTNHIDNPYKIKVENNVISVEGRAIIHGLIDSHSHLIWGGDRSREVRWKLQGKSYSEIANMGGGIAHTVQQTKTLSGRKSIPAWKTTYQSNSNKTRNRLH